jgi:hypothetical protein
METTTQRTRTILSDLFKLQRSAIIYATTMERAITLIASAITEIDKIPQNISLPVHRAAAAASTSSTPQPAERMTEQEEHNVSASAPPVSTTKGSRKKYTGIIADISQPHFQRDKRKKRRNCGRCGLYDTCHNEATSERAQHSNSSKMVSSDDQEGDREGADVELQHQNMGCSKFP